MSARYARLPNSVRARRWEQIPRIDWRDPPTLKQQPTKSAHASMGPFHDMARYVPIHQLLTSDVLSPLCHGPQLHRLCLLETLLSGHTLRYCVFPLCQIVNVHLQPSNSSSHTLTHLHFVVPPQAFPLPPQFPCVHALPTVRPQCRVLYSGN